MPEINEIHCIQIKKKTHYSCIYLTCIFYCFNKLTFFFCFLLLEKWGAQHIRCHRVFEKVWYLVYLTTLFQLLRLYSIKWKSDKWIMIQKGCGRKGSWSNLRCYPGICLEELRKTTKLGQGSWSLGQDLNLGPPEYEAGVLTTWPQLSVSCILQRFVLNVVFM
jgi:hypothetical protein